MKTIKYFLIISLIFSGSLAYADNVTIPNTFTAGTTAKSAEVNANFDSVKTSVDDNYARLPLMWAVVGGDRSWTDVLANDEPEINSINIDVPADGFLVISGRVYISVDEVGGVNLFARLDGGEILQPGAFLIATSTISEELSYSVTTPVKAGTHTVSQFLLPAVPCKYLNNFHMNVLYMPASQSTVITIP